jgi:poly(A) polymerase
LEAKGQLAPQPWMTAPETRAVIAALTAEGATARFVGGCVRDAVLGRPVTDVDIATHDEPDTVVRLLKAGGIRAIPTGIAHGTVTAVVDKAHFEITTLRLDVETYGRRAKVAFTDDWAQDASRRDFTINALFCSPEGTLYDPFDGLGDLRAGRVRFVGDPEQRIREDVLRLLRFFRFHAHYGRMPPDPAALKACKKLAHLLPGLSGERVSGEVLRLMLAPDPASVLDLMAAEGVLAQILSEATERARLGGLVLTERETGEADSLRRLAAVLSVDAAGAEAVAARLRLSAAQKARLVTLAEPAAPVTMTADETTRRRELYRHGAETYRDLVVLHWAARRAEAGDLAAEETAGYRVALAAADAWEPMTLPVKGRDVIGLGVAKGPEVGRLLAEVEAWWIAGDFRATRGQCLEKLRELAAAGSP